MSWDGHCSVASPILPSGHVYILMISWYLPYFQIMSEIIDVLDDMVTTKAFCATFPRTGNSQSHWPWDCEVLHEVMPVVDDLAIKLDIEENVILVPDESDVKIVFPPIPALNFYVLLDFLTCNPNVVFDINLWIA